MSHKDKRYSHVHRSNPLYVNNLFVDVPAWMPTAALVFALTAQILMLFCSVSLVHYLPISVTKTLILSHFLKAIGEGALLYFIYKGMEVLPHYPQKLIGYTIGLLLIYHLFALLVVVKGYGYVSYTVMLTVYVIFILVYSMLGLHIGYHYYGKFAYVGYLICAYLISSLVLNLFLGLTGNNLYADLVSCLLAMANFIYMRLRMTNHVRTRKRIWNL